MKTTSPAAEHLSLLRTRLQKIHERYSKGELPVEFYAEHMHEIADSLNGYIDREVMAMSKVIGNSGNYLAFGVIIGTIATMAITLFLRIL